MRDAEPSPASVLGARLLSGSRGNRGNLDEHDLDAFFETAVILAGDPPAPLGAAIERARVMLANCHLQQDPDAETERALLDVAASAIATVGRSRRAA